MRKKSIRSDVLLHIVLWFLGFLTLYPLFFTIMTSFKNMGQFYHFFWQPVLPLHFENYYHAWKVIGDYVFNSFIVTGVSIFGVLATAPLSAYVLARYDFPGKELFFYAIVGLMMVPGVLILIPRFMWVKQLGLLNTRWGLILPYIASGQAMAVLILRAFFGSMPKEFFDAAKVDGASEFQCFTKITLPLSKAILGTVAILNVLPVWNDFIWPLIVIQDKSLRTITLGLYFFQGEYSTQYGPMMAGYVIASIPLIVLFSFTMRHFISGLTSGAIKA